MSTQYDGYPGPAAGVDVPPDMMGGGAPAPDAGAPPDSNIQPTEDILSGLHNETTGAVDATGGAPGNDHDPMGGGALPSSLPVSMPGAMGGSFADVGSAGGMPFHTTDFFNNRFVGQNDNSGDGRPRRLGGPGAQSAGGGIMDDNAGGGLGMLGDEDMHHLRSILGSMQ